MKEKLRITGIFLIVVVLVGGGFLIQKVQAQGSGTIPIIGDEPLRTVSVNGSGQVSGQPDRAVVRLGVQTEAESAQDAFNQNAAQMESLLAALQDADVASQDIQTQTIQLQPRYEQQDGSRTLVGYTAVNIVQITVRQIDDLGSILDAAVAAGGNTVEDIRFEISDLSDLLEQARDAAMMDAESKAQQLASLAGASLGEVLTIDETSQPPQPLEVSSVSMEAAAVPVQPGTESIQVTVQVTWRLQVP